MTNGDANQPINIRIDDDQPSDIAIVFADVIRLMAYGQDMFPQATAQERLCAACKVIESWQPKRGVIKTLLSRLQLPVNVKGKNKVRFEIVQGGKPG